MANAAGDGFSRREIANVARVSQPHVSQVLQRRPRRFAPASPLGDRLAACRAQVIEVLEHNGASAPAVFGSVACGEDGPDNDIDLLQLARVEVATRRRGRQSGRSRSSTTPHEHRSIHRRTRRDPTVTRTEAELIDEATRPGSEGGGTSPTHITVTIPVAGSIALLDASGNPTDTVTVAGQGSYRLDATTGDITFVPLEGFSGTPGSITYRLTAADRSQTVGTFQPTVVKDATDIAVPEETAAPNQPAALALTGNGLTGTMFRLGLTSLVIGLVLIRRRRRRVVAVESGRGPIS